MAGDIGSAQVRVTPNMTGIQSKIASGFKGAAGPATAALGDEVNNNSGPFQSALGKLGGFAKGAGIAIAAGMAAGAAGMVALTAKALTAGAELEQQLGGAEAVFGEYAATIKATADDAYTNMGLSQNEFLQGANKMGSLFQGAGFDVQKSMQMSSESMQRASDVASIMGIDTTTALEAVTGMAKGNFTMMDNLGVAMNDTTLNAFALEKGLSKTVGEMTNSEKVGLAMQLFMEKTGKFAGNYAKENKTLSGSFQTLRGAWGNFMSGVEGSEEQLVTAASNVATVLGEQLPKIFEKLATGVGKLWGSFIEANPQVQTFLNVARQVGTVIGILLIPAMLKYIAMQTLAGVNALIAGARMLAGWLMALGPIGLITVAVGAIAYLIIANWTKVKVWLSSFWNWLKKSALGAWNAIKSFFNPIGAWFTDKFNTAKNGIIAAFNGVKNAVGSVYNWVKKTFSTIGEIGTSIIKGAVNSVLGFAERTINGFIRLINTALGAINAIPGVSIGTVGELSVPKLAQGGIVPATSGGRLALIGEGGEDEAVIPLSKLRDMDFGGGSSNVTVEVNMSGIMARSRSDLREIGTDIIEAVNEGLRAKNLPQLGGGRIMEISSNG